MATVGRVTAPSVAPTALPGARVNPGQVDTSALQDGFAKLGEAAHKIALREKAKADTASVLEARRKLSDWERSWFDPNNAQGVYAHRGRDALGLVDKVAPDYDRVSSELLGSIKSPEAQQSFQEWALGRRDSVLDRVNGYAVQEHDGYVAAEFKASVGNAAERAAHAAVEGRFDDQTREVQDGLKVIRAQAVTLGEPAEATGLKEQEFLSMVHATAVQGMLGRGQVDEALAYFDANGDDMSASAAGDLQAKLRPLLVEQAAHRMVAGIQVGASPAAAGADLGLEQIWGAQKHQESGGRHTDDAGNVIRSSAGAVGIAQVMPATGPIAARYAGLPWDPAKFEMDAAYNEALGKAYMNAQLTAFGSAPLALAAYNAGPGRVQQWLKRYGDPRAGEISLDSFVASIPIKETRDYVTRIMQRAGRGADGSTRGPAADAPAGSTKTPAVAAPVLSGGSLAERLAAADSIAAPDLRQAVKQELRAQHAAAESARAEQERATLVRIHEQIEAAAPGATFQSVFGKDPDVVAYVTQQGLRDTVDGWLLNRAKRELTQTVPARYDYWDKLSTFQPAEFMKHSVGILADPGLSTEDRRQFLARIDALKDPAKAAAAKADWASDEQRAATAASALGWNKYEGEKRAQKLGEFGVAYRQAEKAFIQTQKRAPTPAEKDELARGVRDRFARAAVSGEDVVRQSNAYEAAASLLTPAVRAKAAAGARRFFGHDPSEAEVIQYATRMGLVTD